MGMLSLLFSNNLLSQNIEEKIKLNQQVNVNALNKIKNIVVIISFVVIKVFTIMTGDSMFKTLKLYFPLDFECFKVFGYA